MQTVMMNAYGPSSVLAAAEVATPTLLPKQVLVEQRATAIDPYDVKFRAGEYGTEKPTPLIPGSSVAGVIVALGSAVTDWQIGDRVAANRHLQSDAQLVPVAARLLAKIPDNVSFETAAAVALSGQTAWQMITKDLNIQADEQVLILGGAGSVGLLATQIALQRGAKVSASASGDHVEKLQNIAPLAQVFDYKTTSIDELSTTFDAVLDTVDGATLAQALIVTKPTGRVVSIAGESDDVRVRHAFLTSDGAQLQDLLAALANDEFIVPIADTAAFNVENLRAFHDRSVVSHDFGKLVLTF